MKNNVAYVIDRINSITGHEPVKKMLQKTVYLLEEKGVNLGFDYILHFYGPYCAMLDSQTSELSSDGIINFDYSGYGHKMSVCDDVSIAIEDSVPPEQQALIDEVINRYKDYTPSDLELLTTAIYAYRHIEATDRAEVVKNIKLIKGQKYDDAEIAWALGEFGYFEIEIS